MTVTTNKRSPFKVETQHDITLKLPFPPSINRYYGTTRGGKKYLMAHGKEFRHTVIDSIHETAPGREPNAKKLSVWIEVYVPDRRKRDLDNLNKSLLDAISWSGLIWEDDCQIDDLRLIRVGIAKPGYVRVHVRTLLNETDESKK